MVKEMDSSRRPFDRSREPGLKKPRLSDEVERTSNLTSRSFLQRPVAQQRFRTSDRDSASSDLGEGGYQPQPLPHQELVSQYKTALAELTFNSKPIITNLTIIAGENLIAAKTIAATVCFNILELRCRIKKAKKSMRSGKRIYEIMDMVPSEQKLPSLYLLDSIVKNIGRDYIKYFAARLPEVFCMAYGQVDPSVQSSMRHLFGTWKGVFPPQTLQIIEKELVFTCTSASSSGGINSRPDLQAQRPPHSIHVNPKYLERQHFQQSKVKGVTSDVNVITKNSTKVSQRPERATNISVGHPWVDAPVKMLDSHHSLRTTSEIAPEKNTNASYGEYERNNFSRSSGLEKKIDNGREKPWFGAGSNVEETTSGQRNGFNRKLGLSIYPAPIPKSASSGTGIPTMQGFVERNNNGLSSSWKNSEEEEYSWDDMNSRLADHGSSSIAHDSSSIAHDLRKDQWTSDNSDKLGYGNRLHKPPSISDVAVRVDRESSSDSLSCEQREVGALGQQLPLLWQMQEEHSSGDPINSGTPGLGSGFSEGSIRIPVLDARSSGQVQMGKSLRGSSAFGSSGAVGKRIDSLSSSLSSRQSPIIQYHHSHQLHNLGDEELQKIQSLPRPDLKASSYSGTLSIGQSNNLSQESVHVQFPKFSQPRDLKALAPSVPASQPKCHFPVSQPLEPESMQPSQAQKSLRPPVRDPRNRSKLGSSLSGNVSEETSEESSTRDLLAAVMKSGILSNNSVNSSQSGTSLKEIEKRAPELEMQPDGESGSPPADFMASRAKVSGASLLGLSSFESTSVHSKLSPSAVGQPSLLEPIAKSVSAETSNVSSKPYDAFSSLLSSLVAKGLISASNEDLANDNVSEISSQPEIQSSGGTCTSSMPILSVPVSSASPPSTGKEIPSSKPDVKSDIILPKSTMEIKGAIGFEFRPDTIRKFDSSVISRLFDDIPYQCSICGIRHKDQEHLDGHLHWHATKEQEAHNLNKMSRRWYANPVDLNAQKAGLELAFSTEDCDRMDVYELMVPSDENQCVCILCGELFEDVYNLEREEWMFKGAVHLNIPLVGDVLGRMNKSTARGPIVHANCVTESSGQDLGLAFNIKTERDM